MVFVLLNPDRDRFYVMIGADIQKGKVGVNGDANKDYRIDFTDAATLEVAWRARR